MTTTQAVGASPPRVDGVAKVTGAAQYVDDLQPPGALFGRTVRSQVPRGRLAAIHLDPDFDWRGVTVVTADNIPGINTIRLINDDQPALVPVGGEIRHHDEPRSRAASTWLWSRLSMALKMGKIINRM